MPDARDVFDRMGGCNVFSKLHGASAYWCIPMREEHKELTAFVSTQGQFEFNLMPFGLSNSQATYQRAVDQALQGCLNAQAFVDDTCIHSPDFESHVHHLDETQSRFNKAGIQLRIEKCAFGYREVEFLSHLVSSEGRRPLLSTLLKISQIPRPQSKKEVRQFVGLINWYRDYIPSLSAIADPLYVLTNKDVMWQWTKECERSFQSLRAYLVREPQHLACPDWKIPFCVETDASGIVVGAVLTQDDGSGKKRVLEFFSGKLNGSIQVENWKPTQ